MGSSGQAMNNLSAMGQALGQYNSANNYSVMSPGSVYQTVGHQTSLPLYAPGKAPLTIDHVSNGYLVTCGNEKYVATDLEHLKDVIAQVLVTNKLNANLP